jgi:hypothetical protein
MNKFMLNTIRLGIVGSLSLCLYACSGPLGLPERNKMPELVESDRFEGVYSTGQPAASFRASMFAAVPIDIVMQGQPQGFYQIPLPDPANDSLAFQLLTNLRPFAIPLLVNWAQQERHGILLDLSKTSGQVLEESNFELKISGYTIPVIVKWDGSSAYRVQHLIHFMQGEPAIQFIKTN